MFARLIRLFSAGAVALLFMCGTVSLARAADVPGMSWPEGQALPRFAPPVHLDVVNLNHASKDLEIALTTLQGIVNRTQPRIYIIDPRVVEGRSTWLQAIGVPSSPVADPLSLFAKYRNDYKGVVVYDPAVPMTVNVATTLAGLDDAVAVSPSLAATLHAPVVDDLRGRFKDDAAAQQWAIDTLWPRTTHRLIVAVNPSNTGHIRDYAVATRAFVVWLRVGVPAEAALLDRMFHQMPPNAPYVGWFQHEKGSAEPAGIRFLSEHGLYNVAADAFANATVLSGISAPMPRERPAVAPPPIENKTYVMFSVGDGDNITFDQHRLREVWNDPARGKVPINWTINPLLLDVAPTILSWFERNATENDYLIAGASGAGYCYLGTLPAPAFDAYIHQAADYMHRAGLRVFHLHNGVRMMPPDRSAAIDREMGALGVETRVRQMDGRTAVYGAGTPVTMSLHSEHGDLNELRARLAKGWDGRSPRFVSILEGVWKQGPTQIAGFASSLGPQYEFVRADQYFAMLREAYHLTPR